VCRGRACDEAEAWGSTYVTTESLGTLPSFMPPKSHTHHQRASPRLPQPHPSLYFRGMRLRSNVLHVIARPATRYRPQWRLRRCLMTLAIETSCDDTSVAIIEKSSHDGHSTARLYFHKKLTSNNTEYQGVHPLISLQSHQENLANLVKEAIVHLPPQDGSLASTTGMADLIAVDSVRRRLPDFVSVTRGPGMRSNLFTGLDTAKGLAVAWQVALTTC
jgi:N6-L-threonylcarbamoyladenine synthase